MEIKPLGDRVLVKPLPQEKTTKSGLVIPDTVEKDRPEEAEVIAVGEGSKIAKFNLKKGDKVLFKKFGAEDLKIDDEEYKILSEDDLLAVIK